MPQISREGIFVAVVVVVERSSWGVGEVVSIWRRYWVAEGVGVG